ncbi:MAG: hypothetical protein WCW66_04395 [Patescibacteria group bacterium]
MFLWHLICMSYGWRRRKWQRIFFLALLTPLIINGIFGNIYDYSKSWSYAVLFGELVLFLSIDRVVKRQFRRALKRRLRPVWDFFEGSALSEEKIIQRTVDVFLEAMAWRLKQLTEDQRLIATREKSFPGLWTAKLMIINNLVAVALKDFWRVHWLARALGFKVKLRWWGYLPSDNAE